MKKTIFTVALAGASAVFSVASLAAQATASATVTKSVYLCSVKNATTGHVFYGKSPKKSFAQTYAQTSCQMQSYSGNCAVKATCEYTPVQASR